MCIRDALFAATPPGLPAYQSFPGCALPSWVVATLWM